MVNIHNVEVAKDHACAAMVALACAEIRGRDQAAYIRDALTRVKRAEAILESELKAA